LPKAELLSEPLEVVTNAGQLISGGGFDFKIQIDGNIHRLQRTCQREILREKPTSAAAYLTAVRGGGCQTCLTSLNLLQRTRDIGWMDGN
jgi:hypothetical protein